MDNEESSKPWQDWQHTKYCQIFWGAYKIRYSKRPRWKWPEPELWDSMTEKHAQIVRDTYEMFMKHFWPKCTRRIAPRFPNGGREAYYNAKEAQANYTI